MYVRMIAYGDPRFVLISNTNQHCLTTTHLLQPVKMSLMHEIIEFDCETTTEDDQGKW